MPIAFGPIVDRSQGAHILHKNEPVGLVIIQCRTKRWRCYAMQRLAAQSAGNLYYYSQPIKMKLIKRRKCAIAREGVQSIESP